MVNTNIKKAAEATIRAIQELKTKVVKKERYPINIAILALVAILVTACSKKNDPVSTKPTGPTEAGTAVPYYTLETVSNLADSLSNSDTTGIEPPYFFSLTYQTNQPASYAKTAYWDLCFSSTDNSFLSANNNTDPTNFGYQGAGKGGITIVAQNFEDVTDIPADSQFQTGAATIGTDSHGAFANTATTIGWYLYDYAGTVVGDGSADKVHVAYAMGNPLTLANGTTLPGHTVILRLAKGDYAKIKMISCYKNTLTPALMFANTPHMFFTFQYVIVPAGSTKFEINN